MKKLLAELRRAGFREVTDEYLLKRGATREEIKEALEKGLIAHRHGKDSRKKFPCIMGFFKF